MVRTLPVQIALFALAALPVQAAEPVTLPLPVEVSEPRQPQVAVAGSKVVHVALGAGKTVYCSTSLDGGRQFADPVKVAEVPSLMLGARRGPRIAATGKQAVITAVGRGGELLAWRSANRGETWSGPVTVNDVPQAAREGLHGLAAGPQGELYCVWLDLRDDGPQVYGAGSSNGGETWSRNRLIYRSPDGNVCECCHPSVAFDGKGGIYVMWRNWLNGHRDLYLSRSTDGGGSFSTPELLGSGHWRLDHCPMDGGAIAVGRSGKAATVWRREKQIFTTLPGRTDEVALGRGEQPWLAVNERGAWITWLSGRGGELYLRRPDRERPELISQHAGDPVIAASVNGKSPVVLVWEEGRQRQRQIQLLTIPPE